MQLAIGVPISSLHRGSINSLMYILYYTAHFLHVRSFKHGKRSYNNTLCRYVLHFLCNIMYSCACMHYIYSTVNISYDNSHSSLHNNSSSNIQNSMLCTRPVQNYLCQIFLIHLSHFVFLFLLTGAELPYRVQGLWMYANGEIQ